jgi:thiol-disulfide isomerase/thioredoxin
LFQKIDIKLNNKIVLSDKKNFEKKLYDILDLRSKYVVNFWATWCIPCKKELPDLKKMKIDNKDLNIIIISIDKKPIKDQLNFLAINKVNELTTYFDKNMIFFKSLKLRGIPTTLLIRDKKIIAKKEGIFSYNQNSLEQINNFFN